MVYRGRVEKGVVVLENATELADGIEVRVEVPDEKPATASLGQELLKFAGVVQGLPSDMARNHDHYLHGRPRQ